MFNDQKIDISLKAFTASYEIWILSKKQNKANNCIEFPDEAFLKVLMCFHCNLREKAAQIVLIKYILAIDALKSFQSKLK